MAAGFKRKKKKDEADLDITPMIDVVFLLLIFFMVTSTMQGTPDKDVPPSTSGDNAVTEGFLLLSVLAPKSPTSEGEVKIGDRPLTLEQFKAELAQKASEAGSEDLKVMIYGERDVKSGFMAEIEQIISEVMNETDTKIEAKFAVKDRR